MSFGVIILSPQLIMTNKKIPSYISIRGGVGHAKHQPTRNNGR
jgi:hypothetical protein